MARKQIKQINRTKDGITAADARQKADWWVQAQEQRFYPGVEYPSICGYTETDTRAEIEATEHATMEANNNLIRSMACSLLAIAIEEGIDLS